VHTTLDGNKPGKDDQLTQAGADAAATELDEITTALRAAPRPCTTARAAELSRIWIKRRRCAAPGPALAPGLSLGEARPARAGPRARVCRLPVRFVCRRPGLRACRLPRRSSVLLPAAESRSLPPVASHAIGFTEPRHGIRSLGVRAYEEDGMEQSNGIFPGLARRNRPGQRLSAQSRAVSLV
jgi:hypothetical protein